MARVIFVYIDSGSPPVSVAPINGGGVADPPDPVDPGTGGNNTEPIGGPIPINPPA